MIAITAGIGENDPRVREMITEGLEFLGVKFDASKTTLKVKNM